MGISRRKRERKRQARRVAEYELEHERNVERELDWRESLGYEEFHASEEYEREQLAKSPRAPYRPQPAGWMGLAGGPRD